MMKSLLSLSVFSFLFITASANYTTPGTGVNYSLTNLVTNSGGDVTYSDAYYVNDTITISLNDTLTISSDAEVKFATGTFFEVFGVIIINPPTGVLFTAQNTAAGYLGMRINANSQSVLRKLTFQYAVSLRLTDCSPLIDSCTFQYNNNNASTSFGNGSIALFRSNSVISNCKFLNNQRAAIQGGANIANAPRIINCLFMDNNTTNQNVPQINLGGSGPDTVKIINNQLLRASTNSGGIGFLPTINLNALITGNTIKNNRYGITLNGGSLINTVISYNVIDSNNTAGNPLTGGSGIAFSGGSSTSHQNTIVTGNYIRGNLWGITISPGGTGGAKPNLGDLTNSDTTDDGKNHIYGNTNSTTPNIEFYNNNVDDIMAQNNYWGSNHPDSVEAAIFHEFDNPALGLVNFSNYLILPIELAMFKASLSNSIVTLSWKTLSEINSDHFIIERSRDGRSFQKIGEVAAAGISSNIQDYQFTDADISGNKQYYRLKLVDKDGQTRYSSIVVISLNEKTGSVKLYPTLFSASQALNAEIVSARAQTILIQFIGSDGKIVQQLSENIVAGTTTLSLNPAASLSNGFIYVRFIGSGIHKTLTVVKQ